MKYDNYQNYLLPACEITRKAGEIIMGYFSGGFTTVKKDDNSPVTEADIAANTYIIKELTKLAPHIPIIAEEDETLGSNAHEVFFLVDPLDGTRSFVRGEPEFTVNIGLIVRNKPVFGAIYCPPQEILYYGMVGIGAYKQVKSQAIEEIKVRPQPTDGLTIVRSRSHPSKATNDYLATLNIKENISGSSSVKFCMVAEGAADIYPRFGRTMEWDTAAGHAILQAAGGRVENTDGSTLAYGKTGFENPAFIAFGN